MIATSYERLENLAALSGWSADTKLRIVCAWIDTVGHQEALIDQVSQLAETGWPNKQGTESNEQITNDARQTV
jgi:hypothetical protein